MPQNSDLMFVQIPIWNSEEIFTITSEELQTFTAIAETYSKFIPTFENMISRLIDEGKVKIKYQSMSGQEMTEDEIREILTNASQAIKSKDVEPNL